MNVFYRPILPQIRMNTVLIENPKDLPPCPHESNRLETKSMAVVEQ